MGLQQGYRLVPLIEMIRSEAPSGASFVSGVRYVDSVRNILLGGTMRLGNYLRVFTLLIVSAPSYAVDYYWQMDGFGQYVGSSPLSVCKSYLSGYSNPNAVPKSGTESIRFHSQTSSVCDYKATHSSGLEISQSTPNIIRYGSTCPSGTEYDTSVGSCVAPENPCADKAGIEEGFSKAGIAPDGFAFVTSGGTFGTQRQGCKGGCATEITDLRIKGKTSGSYYARGAAIYTGQQCATTGTGDQIDEDTNESTDPQTIKEDVPCVYSSVGGKQVCESKKSEEKEGQSCGTVNGVQTCISTPPAKNGVDIRTEVTTETHADGSTTTTKKDTATATTCKGINNCTTKTATTTTTTKKNANGSTTSVGSTCTGSACPNKTTDPDGDGDGLGDCAAGTGTQCGSGTGGPGGGEGQDWYTPGDDTFESVLTQFAAAVKQTPIASQTTNFLTFRASGGCPRWSVSVWVFDIDIDQLCSGDIPWAAIRAVILAAAAFLSFRIALF